MTVTVGTPLQTTLDFFERQWLVVGECCVYVRIISISLKFMDSYVEEFRITYRVSCVAETRISFP